MPSEAPHVPPAGPEPTPPRAACTPAHPCCRLSSIPACTEPTHRQPLHGRTVQPCVLFRGQWVCRQPGAGRRLLGLHRQRPHTMRERLQSRGAARLSPKPGLGEALRCWGCPKGIWLIQRQWGTAWPGSTAPHGKGRVRIRLAGAGRAGMLTVAAGEHRCPGTALAGTMGCGVLWPAPDPDSQWVSSTLGTPPPPPSPPALAACRVSPSSSLGIKKFPFFLRKIKKSQRSLRWLLKAAFKLLHPGPRGQPCCCCSTVTQAATAIDFEVQISPLPGAGSARGLGVRSTRRCAGHGASIPQKVPWDSGNGL